MPYKVKKITQVDTSSLQALGQSVTDLSKYTEDEFGSLARSLQATEARQVLYVAPPKPRQGLIVYADGTRWNPGSGEGPYFYNSLNQWKPMTGSGGGGGITDAPSDSTTYGRKNAAWVNVLNLADGGTVTGNVTFTGVVAVPTPVSSGQAASKGYVDGLAGSVTPAMDGTAAVGTSAHWAHEDHVHPTDTTRAPLASPTFTGVPAAPTAAVDTNTTQLATTAFVIGQASAVGDGTPAMDGTAARGTSTHWARADHVHPTDTTRAPLASPTFTGTPAAPTATAGTNTTQIATCAFVTTAIANAAVPSPATVAPLMDGVAAVGTSLLYARQDHVHPTDTTRAPTASPSFTGAVAIGGSIDVQQNITLSGNISPTALAANTNDYAPTGFGTATVIRLTASAAVNLTGLAGGSNGRLIEIYNIGANTITLTNEDAGSLAANRFSFGNSLGLLPNGGGITIVYDSTASRWRTVSEVGVFGVSGANHAPGLVPDPGSVSGNTKFLREDATWQVPAGGGGSLTETFALHSGIGGL